MIRFEQQQRQQQRQILAPQMQQSLKMLQMNSIELDQFIEQSLEENPFLDRTTTRETTLSEMQAAPVSNDANSEEQQEQEHDQVVLDRSEGEINFDTGSDDDWYGADRHREGVDFSRNADSDETYRYYQDSITQSESLRAHLLDQMRITATTPEEYQIGERIIIGDIDSNGYFSGDITEIAGEMKISDSDVNAVLDTIKKFEPTGVGAADIAECLLLQIEAEYPEEEQLKTLVCKHWDELTRGHIRQIAHTMDISPERVEELKNILRHLEPWPGQAYSSAVPAYITPEVLVEQIEDDFIVVLTADAMPSIAINDAYIKEVRSKKISKEERSYVRENLGSARWLVRNIERRQETIRKTAQAIIDTQRMFLKKGEQYMKPLTLEEVANKVGLHESTISRTVNGKYIQTPQGLFELKYFFSAGLRSDDGESQSSTAICALLKNIIDAEDKHKPLSDQKISDLLKKQGTNAARRTIAKYREGMGVPPARIRRSY
ncbi:MAG: RNA polymerase factor sigma-54 [Candidatus Hydrogenedentes bacterium]|nr:RNA polymerase factor sigma-54 [Candidatus Hydrogenedentota bacterium]